MVAAKQRVDAMLHNREDYNHGNAVDCGKEVVGDSVRVHVGGLGDEVGGHLGLAEPVDYECDAIKKFQQATIERSLSLFGLTKREWRSDHF